MSVQWITCVLNHRMISSNVAELHVKAGLAISIHSSYTFCLHIGPCAVLLNPNSSYVLLLCGEPMTFLPSVFHAFF
jgi:hypothetical protein